MESDRGHYLGFIWHASFLALTMAFVEVNTVLPSMILEAGGGSFAIGLVTAISTGIPLLAQVVFAGYLMSKPMKKPYLLLGIYLRVGALFSIGFLLLSSIGGITLLVLLFSIISVFSFGGVFAGISYTHLLGQSVVKQDRRSFMSYRQIAGSALSLLGGFVAKYIVGNVSYPANYSLMFFIAGSSLFVASLGFVGVREREVQGMEIPGFWKIMKSIPKTLKDDANLLNYIVFSNLTGFGLVLIPFYVLLAKDSFGLMGSDVGSFLLFQMIGMLGAGVLWNRFLKRRGLKRLLITCAIIGSLIPLIAYLLSTASPDFYLIVFLLSGITLSARKIGFEWLLIEISNNTNRALYTGVSGALSLVTALLPLILGSVLRLLGFPVVLVISSIAIASGVHFIRKIDITDDLG
ncbi:MFS transporter [Mesotoga sp.]|uniref:MFS transporter n=1 Tax=Mesotoga sp. TaxID=2053577 RepID=UPI001BD3E6DC|nr:MFS transporter [Mesotoga sp.]MDD3461468.1 MFS transporter [Mesotoga sp.]